MAVAAKRPVWPKRLPRKVRSDGGTQRAPSTAPERALPAQRTPRQERCPRKDKIAKVEGQESRPAQTPASQPDATGDDRSLSPHDLSTRLAAGRTAARLQHLVAMHLFHRPVPFHSAATPKPGLGAVHSGEPVYIAGIWSRRGVAYADALPLEHVPSDDGPGYYKSARASVYRVRQEELQQIGSRRFVLRPKCNSRLLFDEHMDIEMPPPADNSLGLALAAAQLPSSHDLVALEDRLTVKQIKPAAAAIHECETETAGRRHCVRLRTDACYGLRFVLDLLLPRQLDCRPWRCGTCAAEFVVTSQDIRNCCGDILECKGRKQRPVLMTRVFVLHMVEMFHAQLNARALRRSLVDMYVANSLALDGGLRGMWFASSVPRPDMLRLLVCRALESYLPVLIQHMAAGVQVYSGSAVKGDGNFKLAAKIGVSRRDAATGRLRVERPFSVVLGWTGVDGALLKVIKAKKTEDWPDLKDDLDELHDEMKLNRERAALATQDVPPVSHSTDTYAKHRLKLRSYYKQKYGQRILGVLAPTPKADAWNVSLGDPYCPTIVTGEPKHYQYKLRSLVSLFANDCQQILQDHNDAVCRLSAAPMSMTAPVVESPVLPMALAETAEPLLRASVEKSQQEAKLLFQRDPAGASHVKCFLEQPHVYKASTWNKLFNAQPPRRTVVRVSFLCGAILHPTMRFHNFADAADFKRELKRIRRWYGPGRRLTRRRRGIVRDRLAPEQVVGARSVMKKKVKAHFRRIQKNLAVEGLMAWREVALATRQAGIPVQSGTVAVERLWSSLESMMPPASKCVSPRWFNVLAMLMYVRTNFRHFNSRGSAGLAERDSILHQRLETLFTLSQTLSQEGGADHLQPLFDPFVLT